MRLKIFAMRDSIRDDFSNRVLKSPVSDLNRPLAHSSSKAESLSHASVRNLFQLNFLQTVNIHASARNWFNYIAQLAAFTILLILGAHCSDRSKAQT